MAKVRQEFKLFGYLGSKRASEKDAGHPDMVFRNSEKQAIAFVISERAIALQRPMGLYVMDTFKRGVWSRICNGTKVQVRFKGTVCTVTYWSEKKTKEEK